MLFDLYLTNNTILSCLFLFFLIIELYFLISAVITQTFNPIVELAVPTGILVTEAKAEMETDTVILKIAIS